MVDQTGILTRSSRQHFRADEKVKIVQESYHSGVSVAEVARKHQIGLSTLVKWRSQMINGGFMSMKHNDKLVPASQVKQLKKQIHQLEQCLGKKTAQVELLTEAMALARKKSICCDRPCQNKKIQSKIDRRDFKSVTFQPWSTVKKSPDWFGKAEFRQKGRLPAAAEGNQSDFESTSQLWLPSSDSLSSSIIG